MTGPASARGTGTAPANTRTANTRTASTRTASTLPASTLPASTLPASTLPASTLPGRPSRRAVLDDEVALAVRDRADATAGWADLRALVLGCTACPELAATRSSVVFGDRPAAADVVLLGEAPGADEDATGVPFVGRSGQLLDRLLAEAGLPRESVAVLNVLKCRPPANRKPAPVEAWRCRGWLDRQLELVDPVLVVALGGSATQALLGRGAQVTRVRGRVHLVDGRLVLPTYHPSAALRFGPNGEPVRLLGADLRYAARRAAELRTVRDRTAAARP